MRYRIGEVAEFFGITKEGVRHYERLGIVQSERDAATGYRYFRRDEITRLKQVRFYEGLGFSLREAQAMVSEMDYDQMCATFDVKLEELQKHARSIAAAMQQLRRQKAAVKRLEEGTIELCMSPAFYFRQRSRDEASGKTEQERREIALARSREKLWSQAMPPVGLMGMHYDRNLTPIYDVLGSYAGVEDAHQLGLPLEGTTLLGSRLCVRSTVQAPLGEKPDVAHLLQWMEKRRLRLCGDVYAILWNVYRGEDGRRWGMHEVYLPAEDRT
ncbi:MAG: MerR family transcriptional regulator [Clostridia bacterium]|nr:MerR family transcriptional regulator [Clostridia bacterium]